jgi:hypothetical protein
MTESLENILHNSFVIWRKNPNLGLPYLFNTIVNLALLVLFAAAVFMFLNPFKSLSLTAPNPLDIDWAILFLDLGLLFFVFIAAELISAFFNAGAIGMSYKALETGRCSLDDLTGYGGKRFIPLFLTNILISIPLMIIAGGLFFLQMIFPGDFLTVFILAASIALSLVQYSVVIGGLGPVQGIKAGFGLFKENKFQTALLYAFTYYFLLFSVYWVILISMVIVSLSLFFIPMPAEWTIPALAGSIMPSLGVIGIAVLLAAIFYILAETMVLLPLLTVFWTAYYVSRTKHGRAV